MIFSSVSWILKKIAIGNEKAIEALNYMLDYTKNQDIRWTVAEVLIWVAVGNKKAKEALISLLPTKKEGLAGALLKD